MLQLKPSIVTSHQPTPLVHNLSGNAKHFTSVQLYAPPRSQWTTAWVIYHKRLLSVLGRPAEPAEVSRTWQLSTYPGLQWKKYICLSAAYIAVWLPFKLHAAFYQATSPSKPSACRPSCHSLAMLSIATTDCRLNPLVDHQVGGSKIMHHSNNCCQN